MNRPVVPDAHHSGDPARIVPDGFHLAGREEAPRLLRLDANCL
jgi:hypothetical protein